MLLSSYFKKIILFVKENVIGMFAFGLYLLNVIAWTIIILPISVLYLIPIAKLRFKLHSFLETIPIYWTDINTLIQRGTLNTKWVLKHKEDFSLTELNPSAWYLLISNHQNWVDILVLYRLFNRRTPLLKFLLKSTLFWTLPLLGWFCWMIDFPFIHRYSKKELAENPLLRINNFNKIKNACKIYTKSPTAVINFVEGRRLTHNVHSVQASPYQHLLRPKAGGFALTLKSLHEKLDKILNITIVYSKPNASFWDFLCGRIACITIYSEAISVTPDLIGDYLEDVAFQKYIKNWLRTRWAEKDLLIENKDIEHQWLSHEI